MKKEMGPTSVLYFSNSALNRVYNTHKMKDNLSIIKDF